jgi:hypothetical protein
VSGIGQEEVDQPEGTQYGDELIVGHDERLAVLNAAEGRAVG